VSVGDVGAAVGFSWGAGFTGAGVGAGTGGETGAREGTGFDEEAGAREGKAVGVAEGNGDGGGLRGATAKLCSASVRKSTARHIMLMGAIVTLGVFGCNSTSTHVHKKGKDQGMTFIRTYH